MLRKFWTSFRTPFGIALAVSMLFHFSFIYFKTIDKSTNLAKLAMEKNKERPIRLKLVTSKDKAKQIVNTEKKAEKRKPKESKFLSHSNQSYEKEQVAKKNGSFKKAGLGVKDAKKRLAQRKPNKKSARKKEKKKNGKVKLADLMMAQVNPDKFKYSFEMPAEGTKNGDKLERGIAQNSDFVEEIPLGDMTNLNTVEYKYFGFYDRIRKQLEQYWGNTLRAKAMQLFKRGKRMPASLNKITSLTVVLNNKGHIVNIQVHGSSGVNEFDEAAIESFNKAGPFPNPPKGMIKNGQAVIEWGFVVKT